MRLTSGRCRSTGSRRCARTIEPRCRSSPRRSRACGSRPTSSSAARAAGHTERRSRAGRSSTATRRRAGSTSPTAISAAGVARSALVPDCSSRRSSGGTRTAAASADAYLANSTVVAERIRSIYGIEAEVVPPPPAITPDGPSRADQRSRTRLPALRLPPAALQERRRSGASVRALPDERLVVAGTGPDGARASSDRAASNVTFAGSVTDARLRWLYANCRALIAASYEDFGLTPFEAASFGKPTAALRWGGFLDTIEEARTGVYLRRSPRRLRSPARSMAFERPDGDETQFRRLRRRFSEARFIERMIVGTAR